jgi:hypothetical protein
VYAILINEIAVKQCATFQRTGKQSVELLISFTKPTGTFLLLEHTGQKMVQVKGASIGLQVLLSFQLKQRTIYGAVPCVSVCPFFQRIVTLQQRDSTCFAHERT